MGTSEVLVAQSLCGIIWSLFSAQPLLIMAATGPFLIFEGSLYEVGHQVIWVSGLGPQDPPDEKCRSYAPSEIRTPAL